MIRPKVILIGSSTGGPGHLKKILSALNPNFKSSIVIAQHMNATFIPSFIAQFQTEFKLPVHSVDEKLELTNSNIYICPKNCHLMHRSTAIKIEPTDTKTTLYNPSVDTLFLSAAELIKVADIVAVLLTGIGHDGAMGLSKLQESGAKCIAESKESAIVYGMPKRAIEINPSIQDLPLEKIIELIPKFGSD